MKIKSHCAVIFLLITSCSDVDVASKQKEDIIRGSLNYVLSSIPVEHRAEVAVKVSKAIKRDFNLDIVGDTDIISPPDITSMSKQGPQTPDKPTLQCYWSILTAEIVHTEMVDNGDGTTGFVWIFDDGCSQIVWYDPKKEVNKLNPFAHDASCYCD